MISRIQSSYFYFKMTSFLEINHNKVDLQFQQNVNYVSKTSPFMSYNEFFENFLTKNRPCVFDCEITESWLSRRNWSKNTAPNFEWLRKYFGDCEAPVADCNKKYYNAQCKNDMSIKDYIDYWINYRSCNYSKNMPLLYLKDWHCVKLNSNVQIYDVPQYFASDWLNEYYIAHPNLNDDYMFVYMGPKGSWTPFHVDVFTSYSWSANIVGKKRWLLFPPGQENYLCDKNGDLIYDITSADLNNVPKHDDMNNELSNGIEIIQDTGQVIFVPSGWHHQVWNLEDTISINHNWVNGCNILNVWNSLKKEFAAVIHEIEDCKDMDDWAMHCQTMLKASFGMNYFQFYEFISFIAERRINSVINNVPVRSFNKWCLGNNHCLFDLRQIRVVLRYLIEDAKEKNIDALLWTENEAVQLLDRIHKEVDN